MAIAVGSGGLPVLVERSGSGQQALEEWWRSNEATVATHLREEGAVLFRGFQIDTQQRFQALLAGVGAELGDYRDGNSPRSNLGDGVYTSTEYPPEFFISLHNELSYSTWWPTHLWFCCVSEPSEGGETPLADSRAVLRDLDAALVGTFRAKGVRYVRNLHGGRGYGPSWQQTYSTSDRGEVDRFLSESGIDGQWHGDGLRLSQVRPATAFHRVTADEVWFNQADQFHPSTHPPQIREALLAAFRDRLDQLPQNATFGDGTPIEPGMLDQIRDAMRRQLTTFPWRRGDVLLIDNMLVCHGRMPFAGPRRVLVAMSGAEHAHQQQVTA